MLKSLFLDEKDGYNSIRTDRGVHENIFCENLLFAFKMLYMFSTASR